MRIGNTGRHPETLGARPSLGVPLGPVHLT
jgi:hypothetical protein